MNSLQRWQRPTTLPKWRVNGALNRIPMPSRRRIITVTSSISSFALFIFILVILGLRYSARGSGADVASPPSLPEDNNIFSGYGEAKSRCPSEAPWLDQIRIERPFQYARRDITLRPNRDLTRQSITKLDEALFPELQNIGAGENQLTSAACLEPLRLEVPAWPETYPDASHIIFGLSTSMARLEDSLVYFRRWMSFIKARVVIIVTGEDDSVPKYSDMRNMERRMRQMGIHVTLLRPREEKMPMEMRYFSLVKVLMEHRDERTKWAVFMDDDTFFPSMRELINTLNEYDASQPLYLGAMSEEWWAVARYSFMAFGGAGVLLSVPLLELVDRHYQDCIDESHANAGDMRIYECIRWYSDTGLQHVNGLFQIDLHGDRSGLFESGRKILSLHHWKEGWWDEGQLGTLRPGHANWFPMDTMNLVADVCAECFLQRWQFGDDLVVSNGYTIATYPTGALTKFEKHRGLEKVEETWLKPGIIQGANNPGWDHYLGVMRPPLQLEYEKIQYRFLDAWKVDGGVRQFYHHFGVNGSLDTVMELFWIREENWKVGESL